MKFEAQSPLKDTGQFLATAVSEADNDRPFGGPFHTAGSHQKKTNNVLDFFLKLAIVRAFNKG